jgi:type II restriction enzyme
MRLTPRELFDSLLKNDKILEICGQIKFCLGDISIIVKKKDVVGNMMQEWVQGWLEQRGIEYALSNNTQMPPDFFLNKEDRTVDLLEVKAFNIKSSPAFDIADFRMYVDEIVEKPYMLDVDYLIFGYVMTDDGVISISDVWLKKVWEITRQMDKWPITLQVKKDVVHKIRPAKWYSISPQKFKVFEGVEDFVSAIEETIYRNPATRERAGTWLNQFNINYRKHYGKELIIPRFQEVSENYIVEKRR